MPKPVAVNPKITLIRKVLTKLRMALIRGVSAQGRVQVSPNTAAAELLKLEQSLHDNMVGTLGASGLAYTNATQPLPVTGWVYLPLNAPLNARHGTMACGSAVGMILEGKLAACGILLAEAEDSYVAAAGEGASGPDGRLRVSGRTSLNDSVVQVPYKTADCVALDIFKLLDSHGIHTRKSGSLLSDIIKVASGRADGLIATRVSPFEALCLDLVMKEAGGTVKLLETPAGPTYVAGPLKMVVEICSILG